MAVGEAILARPPELSVASTTYLSDLKKAERAALSDGGGDSVAIHAVLLEVLERDDQLAVVETATVGHRDLDAGEDAVGGEGERAVGWRLQHFDEPPCELSGDSVAAAEALDTRVRTHPTPRLWRVRSLRSASRG